MIEIVPTIVGGWAALMATVIGGAAVLTRLDPSPRQLAAMLGVLAVLVWSAGH